MVCIFFIQTKLVHWKEVMWHDADVIFGKLQGDP